MLPSIDLSAYITNVPQRQKVAIGVIFATLAAMVYWQFFLRSEWAIRSEVQAELTRLRVKAEQSRQITSQRPHLEQEVKLLEARLQRVVQKLPAEKEIPSLLKRVANLGQEADLDVTLFKPGTAVMKEFYAEIPVQLKVAGTYHDLGLLFERLGRLERIVNVADLAIRPAAKGQRAGDSIQAEFGVVTYTYHSTALGTDSSKAEAKSGGAASAAK